MVRFRFVREVRLGHYREAFAVAEELSAFHRQRGWPEMTHWTLVSGPVNTLISEMEFENLGSLERLQETTDADPEHVGLRRKAGEHTVEGSARIEILRAAPRLAGPEPLVAQA